VHLPGLPAVRETDVEDVIEAFPDPTVVDRCDRLGAVVEVSLHPAGRADEIRPVAVVVKPEDPGIYYCMGNVP